MNRRFSIDYDTDYGCDHRKGWSVVIDGAVVAELECWLIVAIVKAAHCWWFLFDEEARRRILNLETDANDVVSTKEPTSA